MTHLSAFSFGDGTLEKQVAAVKAWMEAQPEGRPWILAGDFNLLPQADKGRLSTEADLYLDDQNAVEAVLPAFGLFKSVGSIRPRAPICLSGSTSRTARSTISLSAAPSRWWKGCATRAH